MRRKNLEKLIGTIITSLAFAFEVFLFKVYFNQHLSSFTFLSAFLLCFSGYTYLRFTENNRINAISFVAFAVFLLSIFFYIQSNEMKEILDKFKFRYQIPTLVEADTVYLSIKGYKKSRLS